MAGLGARAYAPAMSDTDGLDLESVRRAVERALVEALGRWDCSAEVTGIDPDGTVRCQVTVPAWALRHLDGPWRGEEP